MKRVVVEINDKKHVCDVSDGQIHNTNGCPLLYGLSLTSLEEIGAKITEVREPLEIETELDFSPGVYTCADRVWSKLDGKRFKAKLVEIVE